MTAVNDKLSVARNLLDGLKDELKSYDKISIFVYDNGEIELDTDGIVIPNYENSLLQSLFEKSEVEILSVRQVKQLATLITLLKHLREKDKEFEITYESENFQMVFENLNNH